MPLKKFDLIPDVIIGYLNSGKSIKDIASIMGCTYQNIYIFIKKKNIKKVIRWEKQL